MSGSSVFTVSRVGITVGLLLFLTPSTPMFGQIIISEFMAANRSALPDLHNEFPDWFEIYHAGDTSLDLDGWHASDDQTNPTKWTFPSMIMEPGDFLIVFASAKDILDPPELHTNFELLRSGEFLGIYSPDETLVSSFRPAFPQQYTDFSFGRPMELTMDDLIATGAEVRYFEPRDNSLGTTWTENGFDDSSWDTGPMGLGYDNSGLDIFTSFIQTPLSQVRNSLFVRIPFTLAGQLPFIELRMIYDAGFVAYLNGVQVTSRNAPESPGYRTRATQERLADEELTTDRISLSKFSDLLVAGGLVPGDLNLDGGVNIADPVSLLNFLFASEPLDTCLINIDAVSGAVTPNDNLLAIADWQPDGGLNIADAISELNFLFGSGVAHHLGPNCQSLGNGSCESTCGDATNVLAIHMLNRSAGDRDLFMAAELTAARIDSVASGGAAYFETPTPGLPNANDLPGVASEPTFSQPSGTFVDPIMVELGEVDPTAEIRFTRNDTVPTHESELYTGPIAVDNHTLLKARTFQDGLLPSPIASRDFLKVEAQDVTFTSNLPIVLAASGVPTREWKTLQIIVMEPGGDGRSGLTGPPSFAAHGQMKKRGSSTFERSKGSYTVEIQDEFGDDRNVEMLGMPADSDWVLYAAFDFDRTHMRNAVMYQIARDLGRLGVRTQFCELYLSQDGGVLDYRGIYTFMEKIKRGANRTPVERLGPEHINEPEISGGYMLKVDRTDANEGGLIPLPFNISGPGGSLAWVYPSEREMDQRPEQKQWILDYFGALDAALNGADPSDLVTGYPRYIDVDSFCDEYIFRMFARDPDATQLSTYFFKPRNARFESGPVWDFDRSLGAESRSFNPEGGIPITFWWGSLVSDPDFANRYRQLYSQHRQGVMSLANINSIIDSMAAEITEAVPRDAAQWGQVTDLADWQSEVDRFKTWISDRVTYLDGIWPSSP